jgi:predicted nucleotidyltransferase
MRVLIVEAEPSTHSGGPPGGTNEQHVALALLRALVDPVATLEEVVSAAAGSDVQAVVWFGSIARGEASAASDIDLAFTAPNGWNDRVEMADAVRTRLGNDCGVLVFTPTEFEERAAAVNPQWTTSAATALRWSGLPVAYRRRIENQIRAGNTTLP